jgi:pimeloyl-ACP methyl ester carboxylesterase
MVWRAGECTASDGARLAVFEAGPADGPPVVLVHGYPEEHTLWNIVAERLAADHHVIAYDVRGAGASDVPSGRDGWSLEQLSRDLGDVIDGFAGGRPAHLVGHDWGSIHGWAFVLHPEYRRRVASFVSMSGPALQHVERRVRSWVRGGRSGWRALAAQSVSSLYIAFFQTRLAPFAWRRVLAQRWAAMVAREGAGRHADWPAATVGEDGANGVWLYRVQRRAMMPPFRTDRLPPVVVPTNVPTTLLVSTDDHTVGPRLLDGLDAFAERLETVMLPGSHWLPRSDPDAVVAAVRSHTERH